MLNIIIITIASMAAATATTIITYYNSYGRASNSSSLATCYSCELTSSWGTLNCLSFYWMITMTYSYFTLGPMPLPYLGSNSVYLDCSACYSGCLDHSHWISCFLSNCSCAWTRSWSYYRLQSFSLNPSVFSNNLYFQNYI